MFRSLLILVMLATTTPVWSQQQPMAPQPATTAVRAAEQTLTKLIQQPVTDEDSKTARQYSRILADEMMDLDHIRTAQRLQQIRDNVAKLNSLKLSADTAALVKTLNTQVPKLLPVTGTH